MVGPTTANCKDGIESEVLREVAKEHDGSATKQQPKLACNLSNHSISKDTDDSKTGFWYNLFHVFNWSSGSYDLYNKQRGTKQGNYSTVYTHESEKWGVRHVAESAGGTRRQLVTEWAKVSVRGIDTQRHVDCSSDLTSVFLIGGGDTELFCDTKLAALRCAGVHGC